MEKLTRDMEGMEVLTANKARELAGKKIYWTYIGDRLNDQHYAVTVIGRVITEAEWAVSQPCEGYSSRWEYWKKVLPKTAERAENTLMIIDAEGKDTYMRAFCGKFRDFFPEDTFTCSDSDREVYFKILQ